jgi:hypothetical protein
MEILIPGLVIFGVVALLSWLISQEVDELCNFDEMDRQNNENTSDL